MKKLLITGATGMLGQALVKIFFESDYQVIKLSTREVDLLDFNATQLKISEFEPEILIHCAAKVGGIEANMRFPTSFINDNLLIQTNVFRASALVGINNLIFMGSSCMYPANVTQPMQENDLFCGIPEKTNAGYAVAKLAGFQQTLLYNLQFDYKWSTLIPTNLYGPNDNFSMDSSHVIPALLKKFYYAKVNKQESVSVWGNGLARREFLYVDDLASAIFKIIEDEIHINPLNIGYGTDVTIKELVDMIISVTGYSGKVLFLSDKPSGPSQKLLDSTQIFKLGWRPKTSLIEGLNLTFEWFKEQIAEGS